MNILVTGGAGYIGSHTLIELYKAGHTAVVVDNLCNSNEISLNRVAKISGVKTPFFKLDLRDKKSLDEVLDKNKFDACIHFAGLKSVGESVAKPIEYYDNNINGTLVLIESLKNHGCKNIIFSSSATVYGNPAIIPITEDCPKGLCTNPYGWTKSMLEQIFTDVQKADPSVKTPTVLQTISCRSSLRLPYAVVRNSAYSAMTTTHLMVQVSETTY